MIPLMFDVKDAQCLIVGGGNAAFVKYRSIAKFTSHILILAPFVCAELKNAALPGQIILDSFHEKYFDNVKIVVTATNDSALNDDIHAMAAAKGIVCVRADSRERAAGNHLDTFYLPSSKKSGHLTVSVSSDGLFPLLSAKILNEIDISNYSEKLDLLAAYRDALYEHVFDKEIVKEKLKYTMSDDFLFSDCFQENIRGLIKELTNE